MRILLLSLSAVLLISCSSNKDQSDPFNDGETYLTMEALDVFDAKECKEFIGMNGYTKRYCKVRIDRKHVCFREFIDQPKEIMECDFYTDLDSCSQMAECHE